MHYKDFSPGGGTPNTFRIIFFPKYQNIGVQRENSHKNKYLGFIIFQLDAYRKRKVDELRKLPGYLRACQASLTRTPSTCWATQ